jgi:hypothetical protein
MITHPSGFGSWQDLRAYLRSYNIIADDDETCRLIEEAHNHWPKTTEKATGVLRFAVKAEEEK